VQANTHEMLGVALLALVAAVVGGVPGTTQAAWQLAYVVLQLSMQLVTDDVCASRKVLACDTPMPLIVRRTARTATYRIIPAPLGSSPTLQWLPSMQEPSRHRLVLKLR
jgi:hypothetical protein